MERKMGRNLTTYLGATNIISSLGFSTRENLREVSMGVSGIGPYCDHLMAAQIDRCKLAKAVEMHSLQSYLPLEQLMILSVLDVVGQSGIDLSSEHSALIFSTTKGNIELLANGSDLTDERIYLWGMAERVADYFKVATRPIVISNACISGISAIVVATRLLRQQQYDHIVVVGGDVLTDFVISGFRSFKSLSSSPCRPYDSRRDGLTLGEACASVLLTADRALSCGVVVEGGAITNDANHISGPSRTGDGLAYALQQAMAQSNLEPSEISFVNAHGTATRFNDEMESKAIHLCGLQDRPVSSLKSYFGHTLGAAGVVETVLCAEQLKQGVLFGTRGFEELGVPLPILVSGSNRAISGSRCVKTASGFGGCNAAVVLSLEGSAKEMRERPLESYREVSQCSISQGIVRLNGKSVVESAGDFSLFIRTVFKALGRPNMKFYKMDDLSKLGYLTAEYLLEKHSYAPSQLAIVLVNRSSSLDTDMKHQQIVNQQLDEGPSPAVFVYTLPNVVLGEICIRHQIQGENTFFIDREMPVEFIRTYAQTVLAQDGCRAVIYGWCEKIGEQYNSTMTLIEK